jgi:hypothetical protein
MKDQGDLWICGEVSHRGSFAGGRYRQRTGSQALKMMCDLRSCGSRDVVCVRRHYVVAVQHDKPARDRPGHGRERGRLLLRAEARAEQETGEKGDATGHWRGSGPRWRLRSVSA